MGIWDLQAKAHKLDYVVILVETTCQIRKRGRGDGGLIG